MEKTKWEYKGFFFRVDSAGPFRLNRPRSGHLKEGIAQAGKLSLNTGKAISAESQEQTQ